MKTPILSTSALLTAILASTLASPGQDAAPEFSVPSESAAERRSVRDMMNDYIAGKGWSEGENTKPDGSRFFVACGTGIVQAPVGERSYIDSRVNAFDKAMLEAQAKMAEYVGLSIKSSTAHEYAEGSVADNAASAGDEASISSKLKHLIHAKLDKALRAEGIDPATADAASRERIAAKQLSSDVFSKTIASAARAQVCGLQASCTFEGVPEGGKGEIGVVAVWSPKLQAMAQSIVTGGALPTGVAKKPIREQIPSDTLTLVSTFGVQQKLDENGHLVILAFGQAAAVSDSAMAAKAASDKARVRAQAAIREFAGQSVAIATDMARLETVEEFENAASQYTDASSFRQRAESVASELNISGISTVKNWEAVHPVAGRKVYGAVCAWSPDAAARAASLKRSMSAPPPAGRAMQPAAPAAHPVAPTAGSMENQGASADDDAM